jgi:hypothetical protein
MERTFKQVLAGERFNIHLTGLDTDSTREFIKLSDPIVAPAGVQLVKVILNGRDDEVVSATGEEQINAIAPYGKYASIADDVLVRKIVQ